MSPRNSYSGLDLDDSLVAIAERKAKKLSNHRPFTPDDFGDLRNELLIAIWQAMKAYEAKKKTIINEKAFAQDVVNKKAINLINKAETQKQGKDISIYSLHDSISDDQDYLLIDTISESSIFYEYGNVSFVEQMEFDIDLELIIERLPKDLQELYQLAQIMNITEIAKVKRKSRTTIHKKLEKLKKEISKIFDAPDLKK